MIEYFHPIKVYYRDIDKMGIVYYSRYFEYFEESRTELFASIGLQITNVEQEGVALPVISSHCEFKKGAKFEDAILIRSCVNEMPRSTLKISYMVVLKKTNDLLATGHTIHAFINSLGKPIKPPKSILDCIQKYF
ncbi:MAG: acyl-CoA thioesterase [Candidatus Neomarinimicrobiota bacterium]